MNQITRRFIKSLAVIFFLTLISPKLLFAADGESLFKANCASCHKPDERHLKVPGSGNHQKTGFINGLQMPAQWQIQIRMR